MAYLNPATTPITIPDVRQRKAEGKKIVMVTCYDAAFAKIIDQTPVDIVLVGDSLGNVMLGYANTIPVTMEDMIHHTAAVHRSLHRPLLCADMPFMSYQVSKEQALQNAGRLMKDAGAQAVKLEGGREIAATVRALTEVGIPVMGHLGLMPQRVHAAGGYKVQGRNPESAKLLLEDAKILVEAGIFALVLEMVPTSVAKQVTDSISVPTIGIGAGSSCDGQVLVLQDLLGFDDTFQPRFLKKYANLGSSVRDAVNTYAQDVREGVFPGKEHGFGD